MTDTPRTVLQFPRQPPRLVRKEDCQGEGRQPYRARLLDQIKAVNAGLERGYSAADIRRFYRDQSIGIIRAEATNVLALIETPTFAANALRSLADEIEGSDVA